MRSAKKKAPVAKKGEKSSFKSFLYTLRKKRIIEILAGFIGGGWLILEFVHWILIDHYHFPEESLDIAIVTLICALICTLTWRIFAGLEKKARKVKLELILIPLFILITAFFDVRFIQQIGEPEAEKMIELKGKHSIAVLPFSNLSAQKDQEYFCDGITEEIITGLANIPLLFVIARNSTGIYKGKSVKVQQVGRELGVRYVLEGSVRTAADRIRITAQLIDATTGHHLWAESYDRELKDIFALQEEITVKILTALQLKLTRGMRANIWVGATNNLNALEKYCQGLDELWIHGNHILARQLFEEAVRHDPEFTSPYVSIGWCHMIDFWLGLTEHPEQSMEKAFELGQKALALNDRAAPAYSLLGKIYYTKGQYEKAIKTGKQAVALNSNEADCHAHLACILTYSGKPKEAIYWMDKAFSLNPTPPWFYFAYLGQVYNVLGRYKKAIDAYKETLHYAPENPFTHIGLTESYSLLGDKKKARQAAAEVLRVFPTFSAKYHVKIMAYRNQADEDRFLEALSKAGLE